MKIINTETREVTTNIGLAVITMKNRAHLSRILYVISMMASPPVPPSIFLYFPSEMKLYK